MWLKKDDRFPEHRKIRRLSDGAYRLHDTAMHFAAHDETDGHIGPDDIDDMIHGRRLSRHIPNLVAIGLWHERGHKCDGCPQPRDRDGWVLHDFLDYNMSHEQQEKRRENARIRQQRLRDKRLGIVSDDDDVTDSSRRDSRRDSRRESHDPVPGRTVPGRTGPYPEENSPHHSSSLSNPRDTATGGDAA